MDALERGLRSGAESVQELIVVSFLENLDAQAPCFTEVKQLFGPSLARAWMRLHET